MSAAAETPSAPPPEPARSRLPKTRDGVNHHVTIYSVKETSPGVNVIVETDMYITLSFYDDGSPAEIFTRLNQAGSRVGCLVDAWCTAVSIGLQHGIPLEVFTSKARGAQYEPSGRTSSQRIPTCSSPLDYIARWLETRSARVA